MTYEAKTAARYRVQAEDLRVIAATMLNAEHKRQLLAMAEQLLAKASALDEIDRTSRLPGSQDDARNP